MLSSYTSTANLVVPFHMNASSIVQPQEQLPKGLFLYLNTSTCIIISESCMETDEMSDDNASNLSYKIEDNSIESDLTGR